MKRERFFTFLLGVITGAALFGGAAAAAAGVTAEPSRHLIYVDGRLVSMTAYQIAGNNYVKLRDIGEAVGFNVYWQGGVRIDTGAPYTGQPPEEVLLEAEPVPQAPAPGGGLEEVCAEIIERTNALRREKGLPALYVDEALMRAAQVRADEMAATSVYSHTRPDGTRRTTVTDCPYTTENIHCISAYRMQDVETELAKLAVEEWAASRDHYEAMLDDTRAGIGVGIAKGINPANGRECYYCVQWFIREGYSITWVDEPIGKK